MLFRFDQPACAAQKLIAAPVTAQDADCGAANVRVFGSVARGETDAQSDLDLLVDLEPGRSLFDLARLQRRLEQILPMKVDVISARGLRKRVRETVLRDALPL